MQNQKDIFSKLNQLLSAVPEQQRINLWKQIYKAYILGTRALILKEASTNQRDEIEGIITTSDINSLINFGNTHFPQFQENFQQLSDEIFESLIKTIKSK